MNWDNRRAPPGGYTPNYYMPSIPVNAPPKGQPFVPGAAPFIPGSGIAAAPFVPAAAPPAGYSDPIGLLSPESYRHVAPPNTRNPQMFSPALYLKEADSPGVIKTMPGLRATGAPVRNMADDNASYYSDSSPIKGITSGGAVYFPPAEGISDEGAGDVLDVNPILDEPPTFPIYARRNVASLFLPENLRQYYQQRTLKYREEVAPSDPRYKEIPKQFHSMQPLDNPTASRNSTGSMGYITHTYKVISASDGLPYCLRRVDSVRMRNDVAAGAVTMWGRASHPNIVPLRDAFVSNGALFFLHDYQPGAQSLRERFLDRRGQMIPEAVIWSVFSQVVAGIRHVHRAGLGCRVINVNRIIFTGHNRFMLSGVGIIDVLEYESKKSVLELQREDLIGLGHVLMQLCCKTLSATVNARKSIDFIGAHYSDDLKNLVMYLLSSTTTINEVCSLPSIALRIMDDLDRMYSLSQSLDSELEKECENGRMLRLVFKLESITERSSLLMDTSWADTGNRYLIKLFRDYLFHQVNEAGAPRLDMGHVIECLNKLDVGSEEKVLLSSRDNMSVLLLSYNDLKRCVEQSWMELMAASERPAASHSRPSKFNNFQPSYR